MKERSNLKPIMKIKIHLNQVLKQLARERSEPSSPMSPIISLPAPTHSPSISPQNPQNKLSPAPTLAIKQETSLACSKDYEMFDTPSPTGEYLKYLQCGVD